MVRNPLRELAARLGSATVLVSLMLLGLCVGCRPSNAYVPPPAPKVIVGTPEQRSVTIYHEYTGTTQASESVEIRARVSGYLDSIHFQDGATVPQGQLLFVIDRRPYVAQLDQAKAQLQAREATVVQQESIYKRDQALLPAGAITPEQVDIDRGNWLVAQAGVLQAQAALRQAQLNLDYTEVHAPIGGRISRRLVDVGNLVTADSTLLTMILRYDPMYAYFNVSEANYLDYLKRERAKTPETPEKKPAPPAPKTEGTKNGTQGQGTAGGAAGNAAGETAPPRVPLEMGLANESGFPHPGYIDFAEPTVDPNTGTLLLRGVFANPPPYYLSPGLFVRLRVSIGTQPDALVVPDAAVGTDQAGRYLLVVGPDNVVQRRSVTVGTLTEGTRVIEEGIKPGERFIVEGLQRARPGSEVTPVPAGATPPESGAKP